MLAANGTGPCARTLFTSLALGWAAWPEQSRGERSSSTVTNTSLQRRQKSVSQSSFSTTRGLVSTPSWMSTGKVHAGLQPYYNLFCHFGKNTKIRSNFWECKQRVFCCFLISIINLKLQRLHALEHCTTHFSWPKKHDLKKVGVWLQGSHYKRQKIEWDWTLSSIHMKWFWVWVMQKVLRFMLQAW